MEQTNPKLCSAFRLRSVSRGRPCVIFNSNPNINKHLPPSLRPQTVARYLFLSFFPVITEKLKL